MDFFYQGDFSDKEGASVVIIVGFLGDGGCAMVGESGRGKGAHLIGHGCGDVAEMSAIGGHDLDGIRVVSVVWFWDKLDVEVAEFFTDAFAEVDAGDTKSQALLVEIGPCAVGFLYGQHAIVFVGETRLVGFIVAMRLRLLQQFSNSK